MAEIYIEGFRRLPDFRALLTDLGLVETDRRSSVFEKGPYIVVASDRSVTLKYPDFERHPNHYPLIRTEASRIGRAIIRETGGHYSRFFSNMDYSKEEELVALLNEQDMRRELDNTA